MFIMILPHFHYPHNDNQYCKVSFFAYVIKIKGIHCVTFFDTNFITVDYIILYTYNTKTVKVTVQMY